MKKRFWMSAFLLMLLIGLAGCKQEQRLPTGEIAVLYTNDIHCAVDEGIGYAGLVAYEKDLVALGTETITVDCGDAIQGQAIGTLTQGEVPMRLMNKAGYDVAVPGNHEFDYTVDRFKELTGEAEFSYVACNIIDKRTELPMLEPYVIKGIAGVKVAFVGVATPHSLTGSTPAFFMDENGNYIYDFHGGEETEVFINEVQKHIDKANGEADYVILLCHLGISAGDSPFTSTELIENITGVDAVLDGHSHSVVKEDKVKDKYGNTVVLSQTGTGFENIGVLTIGTNGVISTKLVNKDGYTDKDAEMIEYIKTVQADYDKMLSEKVATVSDDLVVNDPQTGVRIIRNAETNLGDICADAFLKAGETDIAFSNGGGIRAELKKGDVTYGDIIDVLPYGNLLCSVEATGQEILDALELGVMALPEEDGGFLQVAGMTYEIDTSVPSSVLLDANGNFVEVDGERRVKNVIIGGQPLEEDKTYTVTGYDYIIKEGGGGKNMFSDNKIIKNDFIEDSSALINYIREYYANDTGAYKDPYGQGRITATE